ncbi:MAG: TonB-dependent receptor [Bryobacterales bacterium]|nr:TonB-dependent receptor [Bryobacterales bacterium]
MKTAAIGRNRYRAFLALSLAACMGVSALAQERYGEFNGTVMDATGAAIPGAKVTFTNKDTGVARVSLTGANGTYIERNMEPGRYSVRAEAKGFSAFETGEVILLVGRTVKLDPKLTVGALDQVVTVSDAAPLIDTGGVAIAHNITAEEFNRLPKARSFQGLVLTSPSVNAGEIEGGFQVNGASGAENQYVIDGISTNSLINGRSRQNAAFEILQEVQVKTAGIDAEYGGAMGGVLSAITKSGGNNFHGEAHYYFNGNSISAAPNLRLAIDPASERAARHIQDGKFKDDNHELGGSVGGPLIRNKLYFFSAFMPRYRRRSQDYAFSSGAEQGTLDNKQTHHMLFNKLSFDPSSRIRTNFTWLWTPLKSVGRLPLYNAYLPNGRVTTKAADSVNSGIGFFQPQNNYTGQVDFTLSSTSLVSVRGGRFWDNYKTTGIPSVPSVEWATSATNLPFEIPAALRQPVGFTNTPRLINTFHDLTTRTYVQVDYSHFGKFLGQHNFKAGWGTSKTVNNVDETYPGGGYVRVFWNGGFTFAGLPPAQRGAYGYYEINDRGVQGSTGGRINNFYFNDQWRIVPRLTLTLGVRFENEQVPSFRREVQDLAFQFGYGDKIAPRLGVSYDVLGNGKVKVYASYGRYFDWVKYELSRGTFGGDIWRIRYRSLDTTDVFGINGANLPGRNLWRPGVDTFRDRRVPSFGDVAVDPNIKPMQTQLLSTGVEFQVGSQGVIRASYVRNDLIRTMEDLGVIVDGDEHYIQANPGEGVALTTTPSGATPGPIPYPKPKRTYDAMELTYAKRFSGGYFANFSYVYSKLYGNYAGLASTDEITSPATGLTSSAAQGTSAAARQGANVNRNWDLDEVLFDSHGNLDVRGRLATDRPHVFKLYGSKTLKINNNNTTELGLFFYGGSGTPLSTYVVTTNQIPMFVEGRGDMGRTPFLTKTDLLISHEVGVGEGKRLRFEFNMDNLFNQKTARNRFNYLNRGAGAAEGGSAINLANVNLYNGFDYRSLINVTPDQRSGRGAYDPRFGLSDIFTTGFAGRFGVKFIF